MKFSEFSTYLQKLEATSSRLEITQILAQLLGKLDKDEVESAVFLSLGTLGPKYDQPDFGLSDKLMVRILARAYGRPDKEILLLFKQKGDLGQVGQELGIEDKKLRTKNLSIVAVFKRLMQIANASGQGSQETKISLMSELIRELDTVSVRFLVRIPLGTMRLGFSEKTVLEALTLLGTGERQASFAKEGESRKLKALLEEKYNAYPNIGEIAQRFKERGSRGLKDIKLKVGVPVLPQLCQRLDTASAMVEKMGKVAAEYKYDGTRLQVHIDRKSKVGGRKSEVGSQSLTLIPWGEGGETVRMYTRNLEQVQEMFPDLVEDLLKEVKAKEAILDGEAVGFDPKTGKFLPFQETIQRKRKYDIAEMAKRVPVKYFVFDVLFKDGRDLTALPLGERRRILLETVKGRTLRSGPPAKAWHWRSGPPAKAWHWRAGSKESDLRMGRVLVTDEVVTEDPQELQDYFHEAKSKNLEGLIVKKFDGPYEAGSRGFNWVKFKREETGGLEDTIDGVVLGYYKGTGKRADFGIGAFLVGIYDDVKEKFLTIAKIGTGLTDEEWKKIKNQIAKIKVTDLPKNVEIPKELRPDVLSRPEIVVVIRADEITVSPLHTSGFALRFPRMLAYRTDKIASQATQLSEIKQMYQIQRRKKIKA